MASQLVPCLSPSLDYHRRNLASQGVHRHQRRTHGCHSRANRVVSGELVDVRYGAIWQEPYALRYCLYSAGPGTGGDRNGVLNNLHN